MSNSNNLVSSDVFTHEKLVGMLVEYFGSLEEYSDISYVQTHISSLLLTGEYVYKLKKPVNYGFLDFTSLKKRRYYCKQELLLNRRLSPDVYLDVVTIRENEGKISIDGVGKIIDYAVKMRQLPHDRNLESMIKAGKVYMKDINKIGEAISVFHSYAETSVNIARWGGISSVRRNINENFVQTEKYVGDCITQDKYDDLISYQRAFLKAREEIFIDRGRRGHIRDGHGDLQPADIFLIDGIKVMDCIEFNKRFRYGDVASDIAFLAMGLDYLGRFDMSRTLIESYVNHSKDTGIWEFLDFFKSYRAYVRAKIHSFQLELPNVPQNEKDKNWDIAVAYYNLAHSYAEIFPKPSLYAIMGLMGTGKTTMANELARRRDAIHISSDTTRKKLAGLKPQDHYYGQFNEGLYSEDMSRTTYDALLMQAKDQLQRGNSVVLDATFRRSTERDRLRDLSRELGCKLWAIDCTASPRTIKYRLEDRLRAGTSDSDARWELYDKQAAEWESPIDIPSDSYINIKTDSYRKNPVLEMLYKLYLGSLLRST